MTLMKSILLGSAAGIVAVASAQAADLPTRKAAPVEYVRVCNVGGITGWTLPGSDTCVKFSGYITGAVRRRQPQHPVQLGQRWRSLHRWRRGRRRADNWRAGWRRGALIGALGTIDPRNTQRVLLAASPAQQNTNFYRNEYRLVDPGQLGVRRGLQHRLWPLDRARGDPGRRRQRARPASGRPDKQHLLCQPRLSDLGGHHRR